MPAPIHTRCCIAGGGPAGMMLGFLLARSGVDVWVLEKHADFLRDFRGDTIHPSTLELMHELGILSEFLERPHQEVRELSIQVGESVLPIADFTHLPVRCQFLALMPQWDFLDFVAQQGRRYPAFHLQMQAEAFDLIEKNGVIAGVRAKTPEGILEVRAPLTIGADGRRSIVRERAGLPVRNLAAPIDVLWMRMTRRPDDPPRTFGHVDNGKVLVLLNRNTYWQCAFVIPKGTADEVRRKGLVTFRQQLAEFEPFLAGRVEELRDWTDVHLLTVEIDRVERWSRPGLLCIGDAAHAMSPIGGVGINLAVQDAVAAANRLAEKLLHACPDAADLQAVQRRRLFPTRATQRLQVIIQNGILGPALRNVSDVRLPWPLKLFRSFPILRRIPARIVGIGFRSEHIKTKAVKLPA